MSDERLTHLRDALRALRDLLPALRQGLIVGAAESAWLTTLRHNVLPALDFDLPVLLVAVCGGGSTGKSTVFNTLAGQRLSDVGFRAGLTTRVLLAGHPRVLSGLAVARGLLHRLGQEPEPWTRATDATTPGPPLYAATESIPPNLLLIDTPDFDTGEGGEWVNRKRAEAVLRTADVLVYVFTNAVYNNLANTRFMADIVGGIGGRPTVLVYRISRAASDQEVLSHCRAVATNLFGGDASGPEGFPRQIVGLYRSHESDQVALGQAEPGLEPIGLTRQPLPRLLAGLDVAAIKRQVLGADLRRIVKGAQSELDTLTHEARLVALYQRALERVMAEQAMASLTSFPAGDALRLATRLFVETSPAPVRALRATGKVVGAPLRGAIALVNRLSGGARPEAEAPRDPARDMERDVLLSANALRNRLLDDHLILQVRSGDVLLAEARALAADDGLGPLRPVVERLGHGSYTVHVPVPDLARALEPALMAQDWESLSGTLRGVVPDLVGLPKGIESELRQAVIAFRQRMNWRQRLRESLFASLSALPPLLAVSYTLLTADPVTGGGLWIQLSSVFGVNDLWALMSIPASVGLSEQERNQLEQMVAPVFRLWLERRVGAIVEVYRRSVCQPILAALESAPVPDDPRLRQVAAALRQLQEYA